MSAYETESPNFANWSKTQIINFKQIFRPKNEEEVRSFLGDVRNAKGKIRCSGTGHSWSPIFPDEDEYLMDMSFYGKDDPADEKIKLVYGYNEKGEV